MTLGTALFASVVTSVVLVLAVYHKPFRKVCFWVAGISVLGAGIFFLSAHLYRKHEARKQADREGKFKACVARFPVPYVLDGERMSRLAIASACERNPDFAPVQNSSYLANIMEIHGEGTLKITPAQKFSFEGEQDIIPIIYLAHQQTLVLTCRNYRQAVTGIPHKRAPRWCGRSL